MDDIETVRHVLNTAPLVGRGYSQGGMEDSCREAHAALSRIERVVERYENALRRIATKPLTMTPEMRRRTATEWLRDWAREALGALDG